MRWKSTLLLLLITVGIGCYVSLVELKQPTVEDREQLAKEVVRLDKDAVTQVQASGPTGPFALAKEGEAWKLTSPKAARADSRQVRRLLYQLDPVESERTLTPSAGKPLPPAEFGLEPPQASLTATEGANTVTLLLGNKTPVGDNRYLKLEGQPEIFVTGNGLFDAIDDPWETYRSKAILDVDSAAVAQVSVRSPSGSYTLRKDGNGTEHAGGWRLAEPVEDRADAAAVADMLSAFHGLRAEQFVSDEPAPEQLAAWELEPAAATILLTVDKREQPLEIRVGSPLGDRSEARHVKRADEPAVYAVKKEAFDKILKDPGTLRSHEVFEFAPEDVTKLQLAWQGASWTIERWDGEWKTADEAGTPLNRTKVDDWLWKLRDTQLTRFIDDAPQDLPRYGLMDAEGAIRVWTKERADAKEVLIGKTVEEGRGRYARLSERRGIVVELPENIVLVLMTKPESFMTPPAPAGVKPGDGSQLSD